MLTQLIAQGSELLSKPPRLNFAGWCMWCNERGCQNTDCIKGHAASSWMVCPKCDGYAIGPDGVFACDVCVLGVTEADSRTAPSTPVVSGEVRSDAPVSAPPAYLDAVPLPRCLGCGHRSAVAHPDCEPAITGTLWEPCLDCRGRRVGPDGCECGNCDGVGFVSVTAVDTLAERAGDVRPW